MGGVRVNTLRLPRHRTRRWTNERPDSQVFADDLLTELPLDRGKLLRRGELDRLVQAGKHSTEQAAEMLQVALRRHAAEHDPDLVTDEVGRVTTGGFGSGQGMGKQRTRQKPDGVVCQIPVTESVFVRPYRWKPS